MSHDKRYDKIEDAITIKKFVNNYLGTHDVDCKNLRHIGLKSFGNPLVVGVSNDFADKNPEYVKTGSILIVIDSRGDRGSYINPNLLIKLTDRENVINIEKIIKDAKILDLKELSKFFSKISLLFQELETIERYENLIKDAGKEDEIRKLCKMKKFHDDINK